MNRRIGLNFMSNAGFSVWSCEKWGSLRGTAEVYTGTLRFPLFHIII